MSGRVTSVEEIPDLQMMVTTDCPACKTPVTSIFPIYMGVLREDANTELPPRPPTGYYDQHLQVSREILTGTDPATIIATGASGSTDPDTFIQEENGVGDQEVRRSIRTRVENSRFPAGRSIISLCFKFYLFVICRELHYR